MWYLNVEAGALISSLSFSSATDSTATSSFSATVPVSPTSDPQPTPSSSSKMGELSQQFLCCMTCVVYFIFGCSVFSPN